MIINKPLMCQIPIDTENNPCPHLAKIKVQRPNPVDPTRSPLYVCYSHITTYIRRNKGQFLVEQVEDFL